MNGHRFISSKAHGIVDYLTGIALLLAPMLFGFADRGGAAVAIPMVLGALIIAQALLTDFEVGLIKMLPMSLHLAMDYLIGPFLALSPFLFGFADEPGNVWLPHLLVGLMVLLLAFFTQTHPYRVEQRR